MVYLHVFYLVCVHAVSVYSNAWWLIHAFVFIQMPGD